MEASVEALPPAGRAVWTPEEAGRYKAAYHLSLLRQCSSDRKLMVLAQRIGLFSLSAADAARPLPVGVGRKATTDRRQPRTPREQSSDAAPSPGAASLRAAAVDPTRARAPAVACAKKPRRKSEARRAKVEENFEQKRLRRKLLAVLPLVGAWATRQNEAAGACDMAVVRSDDGGGMSPSSDASSPRRPKRGATTALTAAAAAAAPAAKIWRADASRTCDGAHPGWTRPSCTHSVARLRVLYGLTLTMVMARPTANRAGQHMRQCCVARIHWTSGRLG